ncbi:MULTISPECIES: hypothetical protein [Lysobacter]|jgi:hypothetical protein|nr:MULTISPECIES: hypothetical protein [Lysobacter]UJB18238.1 hypothetical protein L1A79_18100 [Lysobacter capsici]UJQ28039.1 hypothetical protein L2D09_21785 [Lysobacter gummosus]
MKGKFLVPLVLLIPSLSAVAGQCETNFVKKGNMITGTEYFTSVQVSGLSAASAIGQVRNAGIARNMVVLDEDLNAGTLVLEEPSTAMSRPLPLQVTADNSGTVTASLKLRKASVGHTEEIKKGICEMIGSLKPGKTAPSRAAAPKPLPTVIDAPRLAREIEAQAKENAAVVADRYKGRMYTVKGSNAGVSDGKNGRYYVTFQATTSLIPGMAGSDRELFATRVRCLLQPNQKAYALTLRANDRIQLTGTFDEYNDTDFVVELKDCVGVK